MVLFEMDYELNVQGGTVGDLYTWCSLTLTENLIEAHLLMLSVILQGGLHSKIRKC